MGHYKADDNIRDRARAYGYRELYLIFPADKQSPGLLSEVVHRSRGRHQPGSGNYLCSRASSSMQGYVVGDTYYALSLPQVHWSDPDGTNHTFAYEEYTFTQELWYYYYGGKYSRYVGKVYLDEATGRVRVDRVFYYYYSNWNTPVDRMRAEAQFMSRENYTLNRDIWTSGQPQGAPILDSCYMQDSIDLGVENLDFYLNSAYTDAYRSLPSADLNNIANIGDVVHLISSMRMGYKGLGSLRDTLSDAWLGYRYAYNTTKSDINELATYVERINALPVSSNIIGHGSTSLSTENGTYTIRASVAVDLSQVRSIKTWAERVGIQLDAYNAWDLIPYSFIVDWFLPIGNILEVARDEKYASRLAPSAVWYSITHDFQNTHGCHQCDYYRWLGSPPSLSFASVMMPGLSGSNRTWMKRGADLIALSL